MKYVGFISAFFEIYASLVLGQGGTGTLLYQTLDTGVG